MAHHAGRIFKLRSRRCGRQAEPLDPAHLLNCAASRRSLTPGKRRSASIMGRTDRLSHARPRVPDCGAIHQYTCRQLQCDVTQFTRLILPGSIKSTQPTLCKCRLAYLLTFFATVNDFWHRRLLTRHAQNENVKSHRRLMS